MNFQDKLVAECKENQLELDKDIYERLDIYAKYFFEWNAIHNLSGAKSIEDLIENIIDSLYPLKFIDKPKNMLDVGTGAGFPGLILATAMPDVDTVLSEPINKRSSFLRFVSFQMGLDNVIVEKKRVEQLEYDPFCLITSRAVTDTALLFDLTKGVSNIDTKYLFYKGSRANDEVLEAGVRECSKIITRKNRRYLYINCRG